MLCHVYFSKTIKQNINQKLTKEHLDNTYNPTNKHMTIYNNGRIRWWYYSEIVLKKVVVYVSL